MQVFFIIMQFHEEVIAKSVVIFSYLECRHVIHILFVSARAACKTLHKPVKHRVHWEYQK